MSENKTIALVTGASSGMGLEFCRQLAARCDVIIAVARRIEQLRGLAAELADMCQMHPVQADLASVEGVAHAMEMLRQKGPVNILVNNAGFTAYGEFATAPIEQQRGMLELHCDATITLCRAAIPYMQELRGGAIINVSSLGSFMPSPGLAVYSASKAFLNCFSQGLQRELAGTGIQVQVLCPGMVRTEIFEPMEKQGFDAATYPQEMWMESTDVVAASLAALGSQQLFVIPGEGNLDLARSGVKGLLDSLG